MFSYLSSPDAADGVGVAFTDREGGASTGARGSLNLGRTDIDDLDAVRRNGAVVRRALGVPTLVALNQVHGTDVQVVDEAFLTSWGGRPWGDDSWIGSAAGVPALPVADAAVTRLADVALLIRVADCVPVVLCDASAGVLGAAHAGRVGFDTGVLDRTVRAMQALGAADITAWIGPHVCGRCYEVPQEMADEIGRRHPGAASTTSWGTPSLDLGEGRRLQLESIGVRVHRVDPCTLETPSLHSHRRDAGASGRGAGIIWRVSGRRGVQRGVQSGSLVPDVF